MLGLEGADGARFEIPVGDRGLAGELGSSIGNRASETGETGLEGEDGGKFDRLVGDKGFAGELGFSAGN